VRSNGIRALHLLKVEFDVIAIVIRMRGTCAPAGVHADEAGDGERDDT
jgi:hypothetical protein